MWVLDDAQKKLVQRNISFVPGLYKIFDEIMVNASDNKQRDPTMDTIKITIDQVNLLSLFVKHTVRKLYATHCIPL
jgi:DNA topoisomerase-2